MLKVYGIVVREPADDLVTDLFTVDCEVSLFSTITLLRLDQE